jgi:tRNA threonylcarbamoyladenosine biosynthesis protein TsaE
MPIAIRSDKIELSSEKKTKDFAGKFLTKLKPGHTIFLYGEIGVGKTTFIKYLINALQKKNDLSITDVTSPTFNLLNEYQINQVTIYHYDLFRLKSSEELKNLDLSGETTNAIKFIEWPQMIKEKPKNLIELNFEYGKDYKNRFVQIKGLNL